MKTLPDGDLHCCSKIEFDGKLNPSDGFVKRKCWLLGDKCTGNLTETLEVTENITKSLEMCKLEVGILGKSIENHSPILFQYQLPQHTSNPTKISKNTMEQKTRLLPDRQGLSNLLCFDEVKPKFCSCMLFLCFWLHTGAKEKAPGTERFRYETERGLNLQLSNETSNLTV